MFNALIPYQSGFILERDGKPMLTPKKQPVVLPTRALAEAMAREWEDGKKYTPQAKPLTALAYTAIDMVAKERDNLITALLAYAETDLMCYRAEEGPLRARQDEAWDPVIAWTRHRYECSMQVTGGLTPVEQPELALTRFRAALAAMSDMELAGVSSLTQTFGSLLLALMVYGEGMEAEKAFSLSRVDDDFQAERWGVDAIAEARAEALKQEANAAAEFLRLVRQT